MEKTSGQVGSLSPTFEWSPPCQPEQRTECHVQGWGLQTSLVVICSQKLSQENIQQRPTVLPREVNSEDSAIPQRVCVHSCPSCCDDTGRSGADLRAEEHPARQPLTPVPCTVDQSHQKALLGPQALHSAAFTLCSLRGLRRAHIHSLTSTAPRAETPLTPSPGWVRQNREQQTPPSV